MLKLGLTAVFLLVFFSLMYKLSQLALNKNQQTLHWIQEGRAGREAPYFRDYTAYHIYNLENEIRAEQYLLNNLNEISFLGVIVSIVFVLFVLLLLYSAKTFVKYDGLALLLFIVAAILGINFLYYSFSVYFKHSHNVISGYRMTSEIIFLLVSPLFFWLTYRTNMKELQKGLHTSAWISVVSIGLFILSILLCLVVVIGIMSTPDLSGGNWG